MSENKVYILQKDLPDGQEGDEYAITNNSEFYENVTREECERLPKYWVNINSWFKVKEMPKASYWGSGDTVIDPDVIFSIRKGGSEIMKVTLTRIRLAEILLAEDESGLVITKNEFEPDTFGM